MLAQANRVVARRTNSRTQRRRRAMSADSALTRAQERKFAKIYAAIHAGREARLQSNMNVTLKLPTNGSVKLVSADGIVTPEGTHYYSKLEVAPPTVFPYEQPLIGNKWVKAFDSTSGKSSA